MIRPRTIPAAILLMTVAVRPTLAQQQPPLFRADTDAVTVNVSVQRGTRLVTGLTAADFQVIDNGVSQHIVSLSYEKLPIDVSVLLDVSNSISSAVLDQLRQAVLDLRQTLRADDRLQVVAFNMAIQQLVGTDAPASVAASAVAALKPRGSSAVIDALAVALAAPTAPDRRQFIVLFSDGKDSSSITSPDTLLDMARRTTPTVSIVLASVVRQTAPRFYSELAAETGGTVESILPTERVRDGFLRALDQFRSNYVLTFVPTGVDRAGTHALTVRVTPSDAQVRARRVYVVP